MLLELKTVSVFYGKVAAVKEIDLIVNEGDFVAIIGANGAGKTSTLNAISGLVDRRGEIYHSSGDSRQRCYTGSRRGEIISIIVSYG